MKTTIARSTAVEWSPRLAQMSGMFDVEPRDRDDLQWEVDIPIEDRKWNVGLIVGPSGCGKSTIARELWPAAYVRGFEWPTTRSVIDGFPAAASIKDITALLSSVGFSSPPSWARPFHVLSNGEQFRATLARALIECPDLCVFDEFTSVVDRTVGQIGSAAVAKTVRRRGQQFIAVTCHDDVIDWLDPDWIYSPATGQFVWRLERRRPSIALDIRRVHHSAWQFFSRHHYLTAELHRGAWCYCAFIGDKPIAFHSYLPFVGRLKTKQKAMRGHRSVVLPDYQGVGIGNALITTLAGMWVANGKRVFRNTGHPAEIAGANRDPNWVMIRAPSRNPRGGSAEALRGGELSQLAGTRASNRLTASFEYVGPERMQPLPARLYPKPSEDAVDYFGRVHGGIELIEFPDRKRRALLVCAGTGLMLSLMDQLPQLRWCIDVDGLSQFQRSHLATWLECCGRVTDLIVVAGWYCSTAPEPLAAAVRRLDRRRTVVYVQCRGVGGDPFKDLRTADTMGELIAQADHFLKSETSA